MNIRRFYSSTLSWSFLALLLQYGGSLVLLPLLVLHLSPADLGIWYAFQLAMLLAGMLDFGYQPTFIRNISYVVGGAQELSVEGIGSGTRRQSEPNITLLASLVAVSEAHYRRLAVIVAAGLLTCGSAYVVWIAYGHTPMKPVLQAWLVFGAGIVIALRYSFVSVLLNGLNRVRDAQRVQVFAKLVGIGVSSAGLFAGFGLLGAAAGFLVSGLIVPWLAAPALKESDLYQRCRRAPCIDLAGVRATITHNARRAGLTSVATFVVLRATSLVASGTLPLATFAQYSISLQLFQALQTVARVRFTAGLPAMNVMVAKGNFAQFWREYAKSAAMGWAIFAAGATTLIFFGSDLLHLIGSKSALLPRLDIALLALLYLFEVTHGNAAIALTCFNSIPFLRSTWVTAIAIVVLSIICTRFTSLGIVGLIISQILANALYNAWKWPLELRRQVKMHAGARSVA